MKSLIHSAPLTRSGQPRWACPIETPLDLRVLNWGQRSGGQFCAKASRSVGWAYVVILRGNPILQKGSDSVRLAAGNIVILDPQCACEWSDSARGVSDVLVWVWKSAPRCAECTPSHGDFCRFESEYSLRHKLKQIHMQCRGEVEHPDSLTQLELEQARLQLDLAIARSQRPRLQPPKAPLRLQFALRWLGQNLDEPKPVTALSDYLQVSPVTLNRLFHSHLHESIAAYHHRLKMERARAWLEGGRIAVKEVSFALGYRHPNDFSRAFKRFTGHSPKEMR